MAPHKSTKIKMEALSWRKRIKLLNISPDVSHRLKISMGIPTKKEEEYLRSIESGGVSFVEKIIKDDPYGVVREAIGVDPKKFKSIFPEDSTHLFSILRACLLADLEENWDSPGCQETDPVIRNKVLGYEYLNMVLNESLNGWAEASSTRNSNYLIDNVFKNVSRGDVIAPTLASELYYAFKQSESLLDYASTLYTKYVLENFGLHASIRIPHFLVFTKEIDWFDWESYHVLRLAVREHMLGTMEMEGFGLRTDLLEHIPSGDKLKDGLHQNNFLRSVFWLLDSQGYGRLGDFTTYDNQKMDNGSLIFIHTGLIYRSFVQKLMDGGYW